MKMQMREKNPYSRIQIYKEELMGYKFSFTDNATYSAADINEITKRLVTSGVEDPFTDGTPHNLKTFNLLNSNMMTSGTVPETDTTLKVVRNTANTVTINPGTAFFSNGMTITVDVNKHIISYAAGAYSYVYLYYDEDTGTAMPKTSSTEPTGDYVMLAHIEEDGTIVDKRQYAVGKIPKYISGYNLPTRVEYRYSGPGTYEIDVQGNKYNFFIVRGVSREFTDTNYETYGTWEVVSNRYVFCVTGTKKIFKNYEYMPIRVINTNGNFGGELRLSYSGNILTLNISQIGTYACSGLLEITAL